MCEPVCQSVRSPPVRQSASPPVRQSASPPVRQSVSQSVSQQTRRRRAWPGPRALSRECEAVKLAGIARLPPSLRLWQMQHQHQRAICQTRRIRWTRHAKCELPCHCRYSTAQRYMVHVDMSAPSPSVSGAEACIRCRRGGPATHGLAMTLHDPQLNDVVIDVLGPRQPWAWAWPWPSTCLCCSGADAAPVGQKQDECIWLRRPRRDWPPDTKTDRTQDEYE